MNEVSCQALKNSKNVKQRQDVSMPLSLRIESNEEKKNEW